MKRFKKIIVSLLMVCLILCQGVVVFAGSKGNGLDELITQVCKTTSDVPTPTSGGWNYSSCTYKCKDGGYKVYGDLAVHDIQKPINESNLETLTVGAKKDFLTDYYNAGQKYYNYVKDQTTNSITEETMTAWLDAVQNTAGVGSQLMTTLMSQTKPDYVTANRLYKPFSGVVGTILGVCAILLMAFLAITMVLDLAYIAIPTFQLFVDGDGNGGNGQGGGKKSFISSEAMEAVRMAEGGQGGGGQNGSSNKLAVSIYFKKRVLMLVVLGICLLYLVSGNIFALVGWFIDLLSGFLGF